MAYQLTCRRASELGHQPLLGIWRYFGFSKKPELDTKQFFFEFRVLR
jgi:hypothetical protein